MEMNYNEIEKNIGELYKIVYAFEKCIEEIKGINSSRDYRGRELIPYLHIPSEFLRREVNELNAKIEHLKSRAVVTYQEDTTYIDALLASKEEVIQEDK